MESVKGSRNMAMKNAVISVVIILLLAILATIVSFFVNPTSTVSEAPAITTVNVIQHVFVDRRFYFLIIGFIFLWLAWRWLQYENLQKELEKSESISDLPQRDFQVVCILQNRSFTLRSTAQLIFGFVFAALFGGVYIVIFVLPQIETIDRYLALQRQSVIFEQEFGRNLNNIVDGLYWFQTNDEFLSIQTSDEFVPVITNLSWGGYTDPFGWEDYLNRNRSDSEISFMEDYTFPAIESLRSSFRLPSVYFNEKFGVISFVDGSVLTTTDDGETWNLQNIKLKAVENISSATFSEGGKRGVIVGSKGSVFVTLNGGKDWEERKNIVFGENEKVDTASFSEGGTRGVIVGSKGSVFVTSNGGKDWEERKKIVFGEGEKVDTASFSEGGTRGVIVGSKGSVFVTSNGGKDWEERKNIVFGENEKVDTASFSEGGTRGVIVGSKGSVFVTSNGGKDWEERKKIVFGEGEKVDTASFSKDGTRGVIVGSKGSVFVTSNGGKDWEERKKIVFGEGEKVDTASFSKDGTRGVIVGSKGSVFVTSNSGRTWDRSANGPNLENSVSVSSAKFSSDGAYGVLASNEGSIFVTADGGRKWVETNTSEIDHELQILEIVEPPNKSYLVISVTDEGATYILKKHTNLTDWATLPPTEVKTKMGNIDIRGTSKILGNINQFIANYYSKSVIKTGESSSSNYIDDLSILRIVTMTILFFLVHILIRLAQYSLRLASFWDSRRDAVLLAKSFAGKSTETFDDLVHALAPDSYDFRPMPKSMLDWIQLKTRPPQESRR